MSSPRSTSSSLPQVPSLLSIPTSSSSSASNADQSPTTPTNLTVTAATPIDIRAANSLAPSARATNDEHALHNLSADDVHNTSNTTTPATMGNVSEQNALDQVLSGILTMQKEVSFSTLESGFLQVCKADL